MTNNDLEQVFRSEFQHIIRWLRGVFPSLDQSSAEDIAQLAFAKAVQEQAKPEFTLEKTWLVWLKTTARNAAIDYFRRREAWSLDAMMSTPNSENRSAEPRGDLPTASELARRSENAERRHKLVSDVLQEYMAHCERYGMNAQREVFERSLRGQTPDQIAQEMSLSRQSAYDHRRRAFDRLRSLIDGHNPSGSILASVFGAPSTGGPVPSPDQLSALVRMAVDEVGALCPSESRLKEFAASPDDPSVSDVCYHAMRARWYLDPRPQTPGCRLCSH